MTGTPIGEALRWRAIKAVQEEYFMEVQREISMLRGEKVTDALVDRLQRFADDACVKHSARIKHELGRFSFVIKDDGDISISVLTVLPESLTVWMH